MTHRNSRGKRPSRTDLVPIAGAVSMRAMNRGIILRLIWSRAEISRADIARDTGLSRSTVSAIVNDLETMGLVNDMGPGDSRGGRRPILLAFRDDVYHLVGVDLGASHIGVAVSNLRGQVLSWQQVLHPVRDDPAGTLLRTQSLIETGLQTAGTDIGRQLLGIGIAVPSPVDHRQPDRVSPLVLPQWMDQPIGEWFRSRFNTPVFIENDANLGALAEQWWGAGNDGRDLSYVKVGTGIGSGHIIEGEMYRGASGVAGEIGHICLDPHGPECVCGLKGCLVTFVGTPALLTKATKAWPEGDTPPTNIHQLVKAAIGGHAAARTVVAEAGEFLGIAAASLVNLLNPATVVLGGGLTLAGDLLLDSMNAVLKRRALWTNLSETRVVLSELGEQATAMGACTLVLKEALADHTLFPTQHQALG